MKLLKFQLEDMHKRNMANKNFKLNIGGTDERDLEQAIQNSLNEMKDKEKEKESEQKPQEKPQPSFFGGQGVKLESGIKFLFFFLIIFFILKNFYIYIQRGGGVCIN